MSYAILARSEVTARVLGAWLELLGERPLGVEEAKLKDERVFVLRSVTSNAAYFVLEFRRLTDGLAKFLDGCAPGEAVVMVDSVNASDFSAVKSAGGWDRLISLLILAFPEIRWVFGVVSGIESRDSKNPLSRHGLPSLFGPDYDPLFDGTGLREWVRDRTTNTEAKNDEGEMQAIAPWIPKREHWALALDDEAGYAYLHGYIAYRHGFRAFAVSSQCLADQLLTESGQDKWCLGAPHLTLEDYYLGFPDLAQGKHFSNLDERIIQWPLLAKVKIRHFVTSGHGRNDGRKTLRENKKFRRQLTRERRGGMEERKPVPGVITMWNRLDLSGTKRDWDGGKIIENGLAPGFIWPPVDTLSRSEIRDTGHSAPGLLLLVAETLIERAEAMFDSVRNVKDAVRGAVLATSATELLGPKTPTTARDALDLKHSFETLAECQFGGIEYNLKPEDRFSEIERDIKLLADWHGTEGRAFVLLNGQLTVMSKLMRIYSEHEELDEAEKCRVKIRSLQRRIWWRSSPWNWFNPVAWITYFIRLYIEFLVASMTRFVGAIALWITVLTLGFAWLDKNPPTAITEEPANKITGILTMEEPQTGQSWIGNIESVAPPEEKEYLPLSTAVSSFFGVEPVERSSPGWVLLTLLAIVSGLIHLGIFVSQVYSIVTRR